MANLAKDLKEWRSALAWTQVAVSQYLRVPLKTYQEWERGRQEPQQSGPIRKLMEEAEHGTSGKSKRAGSSRVDKRA